jgi:hypothetical protein
MSVHSVERALWEVCNTPDGATLLRSDPEAFFKGRALSDNERAMITALDVRALAAHNVNQMLIMMTWNVLVGAEKIPEYLTRLNTPAQPQTSTAK